MLRCYSRVWGALQRAPGLPCTQQLPRLLSTGGGDEDKRPAAGQFRSPWKIMKEEFEGLYKDEMSIVETAVPRETDFLVVGGGLVGSSVAYWLKQRNPKAINVTVVERDPCYTQASSMLSVGGVRHQFTLPENVQMSMFTTEFLRNIKEHLSVLNHDVPDVQFNHQGYLFLVPEERAEFLQECVNMQKELGAKIELLTKARLEKKFPWMKLDGVAVGSYGLEGEGWFDPWQLLRALKQKNINMGVTYVSGEVEKFNYRDSWTVENNRNKKVNSLETVDIRHSNGKLYGLKFASVINCAGPWAGQIADLAGVGTKEGGGEVRLPVEPRKRFVYVVHCPDGPGLDTPLVVDPSGVYFRREGMGGLYLCGSSPVSEEEEPDVSNLDVDYDFYMERVWPALANRVPGFENSKLKSAWAGYYDYNTVDQNLIIGNHPYFNNMFFANGMSGHGVQQAVAIGRAIMELIIDEEYKTIDLSRFSFERLIYEEPIKELAIV